MRDGADLLRQQYQADSGLEERKKAFHFQTPTSLPTVPSNSLKGFLSGNTARACNNEERHQPRLRISGSWVKALTQCPAPPTPDLLPQTLLAEFSRCFPGDSKAYALIRSR